MSHPLSSVKISVLILLMIFMCHFSGRSQDTTSIPVSPEVRETRIPVKLDKSTEALGISAHTLAKISAIKNAPLNVALFAVDRRKATDEGNSDVIMVITLDPVTKRIKMSSIMRDTYVQIEGKGMDKINAAYALGGPQLAIKTINQNFSLAIRDYINVDFFSAAKIVDALGGVNIPVKPAELPYLNNYLDEIAGIENIPAVHLGQAGLQKLNGKQTVAYTRIRAVGHGDYERTERQRNVLVALFSKMQGAGPAIFPVMMSEILPNLETSMDSMTLFSLGSSILSAKTKVIEQARFPQDTAGKGERINSIWYLKTDLPATANAMFNFIYKNIPPAK